MGWYKVTKTINKRKYVYWQRTYRVGKSVKTENKYIGPAGSGRAAGPASMLLEYDRLKQAADDAYAVRDTAAYDKAFKNISSFQAKALGRLIPQWGGPAQGGQMYRHDFEEALQNKHTTTSSEPPFSPAPLRSVSYCSPHT